MRFKSLLAAAMVAISTPAHATPDQWFEVARGNNTVVMMRNDDIAYETGITFVWTKNIERTGAYDMTLWKFDCAHRLSVAVQSTNYTAAGRMIRTYDFSILPDEMNPVIPDSVGEAIGEMVCNWKVY